MERSTRNYEGQPDLRSSEKKSGLLAPYRYEMIQKYSPEKKATLLQFCFKDGNFVDKYLDSRASRSSWFSASALQPMESGASVEGVRPRRALAWLLCRPAKLGSPPNVHLVDDGDDF